MSVGFEKYLDEKFSNIDRRFDDLNTDVNDLKKDVKTVTKDISTIKLEQARSSSKKGNINPKLIVAIGTAIATILGVSIVGGSSCNVGTSVPHSQVNSANAKE